MRAGLVVLATIVLAQGCTTPAPPPAPRTAAGDGNPFELPRRSVRGLRVATFRDAMALPPAELDVGRAALLLAREDRPGLDLAEYLTRLDVLAADLRDFMAAHPHVSRRDALAGFLYSRFVVDPEDPEGHSPENLYLDRVLDRRRGYCVSLSLLGMAVAERLDLPVEGVREPFHYFLRIDGRNVETTAGGEERPARAHHRPVPPRSIFADVLSNRGALAHDAGNLELALESLDLAIAVDPTLAFAWHNRGVVQHKRGELERALADLDRALELDPSAAYSYSRRALIHEALGAHAAARRDRAAAAMQSLPGPRR